MNAEREGLYYPSFSLRGMGDKCRWYHEKKWYIVTPFWPREKLAPSLSTYTFALIFFFFSFFFSFFPFFVILFIQLDNREPSKIDYIFVLFFFYYYYFFFLICSSVYYLRTIKWSYIAKFFLPKSLKYHLPRDHIIFLLFMLALVMALFIFVY